MMSETSRKIHVFKEEVDCETRTFKKELHRDGGGCRCRGGVRFAFRLYQAGREARA